MRGDPRKNSDPAVQRERSKRSPWRRGPMCDTPAAKLAALRYRKNAKQGDRRDD